MIADETSGLWQNLALFVIAGLLILVFGMKMTRVASELATRTRLGEAILGGFFIGASTSLPEIATSLTAAINGHADLAVSNAIGSVAGQTVFLAIADMTYRKANLEHAAASAENLMLSAFVIIMLSITLLAAVSPWVVFGGVHPVSVLMILVYIYGIRLVSRTQSKPMWLPRRTAETRSTIARDNTRQDSSIAMLWLHFTLAASLTAMAGWLLARTAIPISIYSGLSETLFGGLFVGITGSLPELVSALVAVRLGALTLAVGSILGGNAFDTLIVALSDWVYPGGSIFVAAGGNQVLLLTLSILLTAILMMGLVYREKHGIANIGIESFLILCLYLTAFGLLLITG